MSTLRIRASLWPLLLTFATGACSETAPPFDHGLEGSGAMAGTAGSAGVAGTAGTAGDASGGMAGASGAGATGGMTPIIPIPEPAGGTAGMAGSAGTAGTAGTGGRMVTDDCAASMATATDMTTIVPADIIFAIDTSSSMAVETEFVQTFMNEFSAQITAAGIDARVILLGDPSAICIGAPLGSGQCPDDSNPPSYIHVDQEVRSHDALDVLVASYPNWSQHLRPEASKSFVVVTDDDASEGMYTAAEPFLTAVTDLDPVMFEKFTFNGVYCFTDCTQAAAIGAVYIDLVAATQGVGGDLCLQDFQPVFDRLAEQIVMTSGAEITCEWPFPAPPAGQSFATDLVAVDRTVAGLKTPLVRVSSEADCATGGFYFDSMFNPTKLIACPSTCTELQGQVGGQVDVTFGCEEVGSCVAADSSTISGGADACTWPMPMPPAGQDLDLASVNVRYTSATGFATNLGKVASAADCALFANGFYYDNPEAPTQIVACPETCAEIQAGAVGSKVEALFGCMAEPPIPR
jgi:hypothetical protein